MSEYKRKFGGGPKPDDPRRCQRRAKKGFEHLPYEERPLCCNKYALKGQRYCRKHNANNLKGVKGHGKMPAHYKVITMTLASRLREMEQNSHNALSLREELALVRVTADEAVAMFSVAFDHKLQAEASYQAACASGSEAVIAPERARLEKARLLHDAAASTLRAVFKEVRDTALDAAKIEALSAGKFTAGSVKSILSQATLLLHEVCGDEHDDIARRFEELLYTRVKLDVLESTGTLITPDKDAIEMDESVPVA